MFNRLQFRPLRTVTPPVPPVVEVADQSVRLARIARELIEIARNAKDPLLVEALGRPIQEILDSSNALSSSVIRQAKQSAE